MPKKLNGMAPRYWHVPTPKKTQRKTRQQRRIF